METTTAFMIGFSGVAGAATALVLCGALAWSARFIRKTASRYKQAGHKHFRSPEPPLSRSERFRWAVTAAWAWDM